MIDMLSANFSINPIVDSLVSTLIGTAIINSIAMFLNRTKKKYLFT